MSLKGAVRMNHLRKFTGFLSNPARHLDTLNSNPGCTAPPPSTAPAPRTPSSPKRQKLTHPSPRPRDPEDDDVDVDQVPVARTERQGSQSSFAQSTSPGVAEFQSVEAATRRDGRSNRRSRRQPATASWGDGESGAQRGMPQRSESIDDDFDSLGPPRASTGEVRTVRLAATLGQKPGPAAVHDAADRQILQGMLNRTSQPARGKKRSSREVVDGIEDTSESSEEPPQGTQPKPGAATAAEASTEPASASISRRGDLTRTRFQSKPAVDGAFVVTAAVCNPDLCYGLNADEDPCFLKPTPDSELRPYTKDGGKAAPYEWLKVSPKTMRSLSHHPSSRFVRMFRSTEQSPSMKIGAKMMIEFSDMAHAAGFVQWIRENIPGIAVTEMQDGSKLDQTWKIMQGEIHKAQEKGATRPSSADTPPTASPWSTGPPPPTATAPPNASQAVRSPPRAQMRQSLQQRTPSLLEEGRSSVFSRPSTRLSRARQMSLSLSPPPAAIRRWSEENPNWARDWKMPLIFARTTVNKEDIPRLDEGQCLNDNLIGYGLRYLFDKLDSRHPDLHKRVYLHNSFFYEKLKASRGAINYDGVKNWTAKVDLLSYDYIVVPVNEHYHWWVAIICNPGRLDPDARKDLDKPETPGPKADGVPADVEMTGLPPNEPGSPRASPAAVAEVEMVKSDIVDLVSGEKDGSAELSSSPKARRAKKPKAGARPSNPKDPRIITLDSLGSTHPQAISHLKKYLLAEFKHKRNKEIAETPQQLGMKAVNIPEQNNLCDCGVYLLGYVQEFVKNPDQFIETLLQKERPDWNFDPSKLRELWRDTILSEQKRYQLEEIRKKREAALAARSASKSNAPSPHQPSRDASELRNGAGEKGGLSGTESSRQPSSTTPGCVPPSGARLGGSSAPGSSPAHPLANQGKEAPSSPSTRGGASLKPLVPQPLAAQPAAASDEELTILPPKPHQDGEDIVMTSIETADAEPARRQTASSKPPNDGGDDKDEVQLIETIPDSDDDVKEVDIPPAAAFSTSSTSARASRSRSALTPTSARTTVSSPIFPGASRPRKTVGGARPKQYTSGRLRPAGSPELEPAVVAAEVVRDQDPIDLT
ncbi:hypothetical protein VTJ83DRAFT_5814 [Remersonia thermophila]|uniref:Ubiquitin-like protease family profile domain-containing protein n=1 Tax=Remersonia thermophila TaxID=72144 RepID=A0ABR4DA48_9PEZI